MPLLNKKPFQRNPIPPGLKDTDKVFYCDVTNEIFDNYQEFAERIILCNSLVWACEETNKSGLTFIEAVECERNAKKLLNAFPAELRRPVLYLVTLCNRTALNDLIEEIFAYVRERFFVGEVVEYSANGDQWIRCRVLQVTTPTPKELAEMKNGVKPNEKQFWPPGSSYHYELEILAKSEGDSKNVINTVGSNLRRQKSTYTRDRNHLFIKHFVSKVDGVWKLKPNTFKRYNIGEVNFDEVFAGQPPKFPRSDSPKKPTKKSLSANSLNSTPVKTPNKGANSVSKVKKQESIDKYLKPKVLDRDGKSPVKRNSTPNSSDKKNSSSNKDVKGKQLNSNSSNTKKTGEKRKSTEEILERELQEKRKKMMEHQQHMAEKKFQKQLDTQRKRDEKKKLEEFVKEWNKTREDLELEDLRDLPPTRPIHLDTPNEYFGQLIMFYEFFQTFFEQVCVKNFFPAGVTIDLLDRAISQRELAGPLCDFIHLLLSAIFKLQEEEEDEIGETYDSFAVSNFDPPNMTSAEKFDPSVTTNVSSIVNTPEAAINWSLAFHGVPLPKLGVDATTISEVLRLHLLSAGARVSEVCSRWRTQEKCGYTNSDDPAVIFRQENKHIIRLLSEKSVSALPITDKIAVLECLVDQIVMYSGIRSLINESVENYRQKRVELRTALAAELKKEKELALKKKEKKPTEKSPTGDVKPAAENANDNVADQVNLEAIEKEERAIQRKKEELRKQLAELMAENMRVQLTPLGLDRAYRRFWVFPTFPGIFVEDNELNPPPCLPRGTPAPNSVLMKEKDSLSYVKNLFHKEYNKENLGISSATVSSPRKMYVELMSKEETSRNPLACWGDNEICPVHSNKVSRMKWSYYRTEEDFENLLNALNSRGKRESKLRAMLMQHRENIIKSLARPTINLNKLAVTEENENTLPVEPRKSSRGGNPTYEDAMFDYPMETDVEEVLESLLRNTIANIEERTNAGGLGCLKVLSRDAWVEAIKNNTYIKSCDQLTWGPTNEVTEEAEKDTKSIPKEKKYTNLEKFNVLNEFVSNINPRVKEMAQAVLQLEQSIELHYLKPPLGTEKSRHPSKTVTGCTDLLKRWEFSLMGCTSFAQLFLHINTLENSIAWNRSAQNAYCRICRRRGDAQNMLLCDSCNKGHHLYCLKPKLTKIPKGDWFCHYCKPPVKEVKERKRITYTFDSDDELSDRKTNVICMEKMELANRGKCKICNEKGNTIGCSKCAKRYHLSCIVPPLRKIPTITWACHSCRHISARKDEEVAFMMNGHRRRTRHSLESDYSRQLPLDNATLQEMLEKIMHHEDSWPFIRPVSKAEAADYSDIVKRPMDFGTIKHKLNMLEYHTNSQVISDSMLVFNNCFLYNKESSEIHQMGARLMEYFKEVCEELNFKRELLEVENQTKMTNGEEHHLEDEEEQEEQEEQEDAEADTSNDDDDESYDEDAEDDDDDNDLLNGQELVIDDTAEGSSRESSPPAKRARTD